MLVFSIRKKFTIITLFLHISNICRPYDKPIQQIDMQMKEIIKERVVIMMYNKKITVALMTGAVMMFAASGCAKNAAGTGDATVKDAYTQSANALQDSSSETALEFDEEDLDSSWNNEEAVQISLNGSSVQVNGSGAEASQSVVTITKAGTYVLSGTLSDGQIVVNCADKGTVRLVFNGVSLSCSSAAPVIVSDAKKVLITLADGTSNTVTDSGRDTAEDEDYSGAISSKADMVINGTGSLKVEANYRNGIKSSDDLKIVSGNIEVDSKEDGIIGKDLLGISGGTFVIRAGAAGMKSTYDTDTSKGNVIISGGKFTINSENDGIHANAYASILGGSFEINSGDDGIHADVQIQIDDGEINILKSYEGIESEKIKINGGDISVTASDDGINASNGNSGGFGGNMAASGSSDVLLEINGGRLYVDAGGDGLDSNGTVAMSGGEVIVCGPVNDGNAALDFDGSFAISGGTLMAFGSSGMLEMPTSAENGCCLAAAFNTQSGGTEFTLTDSSGNTILTFTPSKNYASAIVYSAEIEQGGSYTMNAGSESVSLTATDSVTGSGTAGGFGGQGGIGGQGGFGGQDKFGGQGGFGSQGEIGGQDSFGGQSGIGGQGGFGSQDNQGDSGCRAEGGCAE